MKVSGILSALVFAHVALGQATDSTSTSVSAHTSKTSTKTGTKSSQSSSTSSSAPEATPTDSTSSLGPLTETHTSDSNPYFPAGISSNCSAFLTALDTDSTISTCMGSLTSVLSAFTSGSGPTSAVASAQKSLCSNTACSEKVMRAKLTEFGNACADDLANDMIAEQYNTWYLLTPFLQAVCTKDTTTQESCLLNIGATSSTSQNSTSQNARRSNADYAAGHLTKTAHKRAQTVLTPNFDTYSKSYLLYLFTSPELSSEQLCTSCTQQIVSKYAAFKTATPYALTGKSNALLGGLNDIWAAMSEKCSASYMADTVNIAGLPSADQLADGAVATTASYFTALAAAFAAAFALF